MNIIWSFVLTSLLLCRSVWSLACHREEQFVKVEGVLPTINPIKTTTVTASAFCSTECVDFPGCNSFAYLTATGTDNCQLSASVDGESTTALSVVYKKVPAKSRGCVSSPCLNGATCEDVCYEPYYLCRCPADKQGRDCEWNIACNVEDWELAFDNPGTYVCSGTTSFMSGFGSGVCTTGLDCLNRVKCCPVPVEFSLEQIYCTRANWYNSFATETWNNCPDGHFVTGLVRASQNILSNIEEGVCCKPPSAPNHWGDCYFEDITSSFDVPHALVGCQQPLYYIAAIHTHACDDISCMEELKCCRIAIA